MVEEGGSRLSEEYDEEIVEWLRRSREQIGELDEVLITPSGEVIDGKHRLKAYPGWKTRVVQVDELNAIIQRVHRNIHRKPSVKETKEAIVSLALALEKAGTPPEFLVDEIKKHLPYSEDYIRRMLPAKFKRKTKPKSLPVKILTQEPKPLMQVPTVEEKPKYYICPVCASKLTLKGDVLVLVS